MRNGEVELWRAVILQAIKDANGGNGIGLLERNAAKNWFSRGGLDFELVCELAEIDSNAIRESFLESRTNKNKQINI